MPRTLLLALAVAAAVLIWKVPALRTWLRRRIDDKLAGAHAKLGPMSPQELVKAAVQEAVRSATHSRSMLVMPNRVEVGVSPVDFDRLGPLRDLLRIHIMDALREKAEEDELTILGQLVVRVFRDPKARSHRPRFSMSLQGSIEDVPGMGEGPGAVRMQGRSREPRAREYAHAGRSTRYSRPESVQNIDGVPTRRMCALEARMTGSPPTMLHCEEGVHSGGRNERCDLVLDHPTISGWHFELTVSRDGVFVRDLGSRNGTRVKGEGVATEPVELHDDDVVLLSREVSLRVARGAAARKAA